LIEKGVFLLIQDNDDVTGLEAGFLISLSSKGDLLSVLLHALVDLHLENLLLAIDLAAIDLFAAELGVDALALALTF
jgi:hypothetical protein